jgi:Type II secretion system (T2SS), protein E, N-terminal domain
LKLIPSIAMPVWAAGLKLITSRCQACHRSLVLRQLSTRKSGIRMHDSWYCSSRCFTAAAEQEISRLLTSGMAEQSHISRMPLGLDLISHGLLTIEQLRKVTSEQKEAGGEIGELLVRNGSVSEKQVTAIRATEWGCPVFAVPKHRVRIGIDIPSTLIQMYSMIPVHYVAATNLLLVGFVHNIDYGLLYAIEQMTGCRTQPCFVTPSDFQIQIQQRERAQEQPGDTPAKEVKFESIQTPGEIARILCTSCLEMEAEEAFIGKCKEYLWTRLKCGSKAIDLLFRAG